MDPFDDWFGDFLAGACLLAATVAVVGATIIITPF